MAFDFGRFCEEYRIDFVTTGPNVAKGHINVQCPWCGDDDPSHHMGYDLSSGAFGCWRDSSHRGYAQHKLVAALLGINYEKARSIVGVASRANLSKFDTFVADMFNPNTTEADLTARKLDFSPDIRPLGTGMDDAFCTYILKRGFDSIYEVAERYSLHYALTGDMKWRVIFPIIKFNELVSWTGRTIRRDETLRYKSLTSNPEKAKARGTPLSLINPKRTIWNYDDLAYEGGNTLYVCEGPMDAIKVDYYGYPEKRATCLFSMDLTPEQLWDIHTVFSGFHHVKVLFDAGYISQTYKCVAQLAGVGATPGVLPDGTEDPGELTPTQVNQLQ